MEGSRLKIAAQVTEESENYQLNPESKRAAGICTPQTKRTLSDASEYREMRMQAQNSFSSVGESLKSSNIDLPVDMTFFASARQQQRQPAEQPCSEMSEPLQIGIHNLSKRRVINCAKKSNLYGQISKTQNKTGTAQVQDEIDSLAKALNRDDKELKALVASYVKEISEKTLL